MGNKRPHWQTIASPEGHGDVRGGTASIDSVLPWRGPETGRRRPYPGTQMETAETAKGGLRNTAPVLAPTGLGVERDEPVLDGEADEAGGLVGV